MSSLDPQLRRAKAYLQLLNKILGSKCDKFLDIGCSDGSLTKVLSKYTCASEVYGVDIEISLLAEATKKGIQTTCLDIEREKLPFPSDYFDLILIAEVVEHLRDPDNLLKEARRVLSKDGFLLLSTPNCCSWFNRLLVLFGYPCLGIDLSSEWRYTYPLNVTGVISGHVRLYTLDSLRKLMEHHGLKVVKTQGCRLSWIKTNPNPFIDLVDRIFSVRASLSNIIIVLCKKS